REGRLMPADIAHLRRIAWAGSLALVIASSGGPARAESRLAVHYGVTVAALTVGRADVDIIIGNTEYTSAASGRASRLLPPLVTGERTLAPRGAVADGRLVPASFRAKPAGDEETSAVTMTLEGGDVKDVTAETSAPDAERVPLTVDHRKGVVDPLSALLIQV